MPNLTTAATFALWGFFGLFTSVWKLAILAGAIALFVWRSGVGRSLVWHAIQVGTRPLGARSNNAPGANLDPKLRRQLSWKVLLFAALVATITIVALNRWLGTLQTKPRETPASPAALEEGRPASSHSSSSVGATP